jgi:EAL domain-containing protein (putative c-di-GMP-specific phosphodiesterase class I)/GGDEF domain-containing protein
MSTTNLLEALPDLIVLMQRDGAVLRSYGGRGVAGLKPGADAVGKSIETVWPEAAAKLVKQLARDALARRATAEATFEDAGHCFEMRVTVQGADMAICVVRPALGRTQADSPDMPDGAHGQLDRRALMRCFKELISVAALRKKPTAVAVIQVDGVIDIEQLISVDISERIMRGAILRLRPLCCDSARGSPWWYLGQLGDNVLMLVLATADREAIETGIAQVCDNLRQPIGVGDAVFQLTPYPGIAILGQDASSAKILLRHASLAATEARRTRSSKPCFYSDTSELNTAAPLDIASDLKDAIANGDVRLRYISRHDLATGRLHTWVGYLRWRHRVYGEIRPIELLRLAEVTGLSRELSLAALKCVGEDFPTLARQGDGSVRVSFGPPRQHLLQDGFVRDIERFLAQSSIPADRLELRISVKASLSRAPTDFNSLARRGVHLIVDEIGRGMDFPLDWLARAPMRGLQLSRSWVTAALNDAAALKMCRAGTALSKALGWTPIAVGVDGALQRDTLLDLGCEYGSGELYGDSLRADFRRDIIEETRTVVAA